MGHRQPGHGSTHPPRMCGVRTTLLGAPPTTQMSPVWASTAKSWAATVANLDQDTVYRCCAGTGDDFGAAFRAAFGTWAAVGAAAPAGCQKPSL